MLKANDPCWCGSGRKFKRCHRDTAERLQPGHLSPMRTVPRRSPGPTTPRRAQPVRTPEPRVKSPDVIERMRVAGRAAAEVLELGGAAVAPGVTTDEIDAVVHQAYIDRGGYPSTLNYRGYPKSLCTSVNEVICHGIPDDRALRDGDIVNLDVTIFLDGVHGDTNATFLVGDVDDASRRLVEVTRECLELGIAAVVPGPAVLRHRPGHREPRHRQPLRGRPGVRRPRHRRAVPHRPADPALLRAPPHHGHGAGHGLHHRAHDLHRHRCSTASGTTTGPRSPPTAAAPPSSSTPCSSPTTASRSSPSPARTDPGAPRPVLHGAGARERHRAPADAGRPRGRPPGGDRGPRLGAGRHLGAHHRHRPGAVSSGHGRASRTADSSPATPWSCAPTSSATCSAAPASWKASPRRRPRSAGLTTVVTTVYDRQRHIVIDGERDAVARRPSTGERPRSRPSPLT